MSTKQSYTICKSELIAFCTKAPALKQTHPVPWAMPGTILEKIENMLWWCLCFRWFCFDQLVVPNASCPDKLVTPCFEWVPIHHFEPMANKKTSCETECMSVSCQIHMKVVSYRRNAPIVLRTQHSMQALIGAGSLPSLWLHCFQWSLCRAMKCQASELKKPIEGVWTLLDSRATEGKILVSAQIFCIWVKLLMVDLVRFCRRVSLELAHLELWNQSACQSPPSRSERLPCMALDKDGEGSFMMTNADNTVCLLKMQKTSSRNKSMSWVNHVWRTV